MNKKVLSISTVLILLACGYIAAGPHIAVHNIKTGFINKDSVKLSENIDFQSLRQNLKDQINASMLSMAAEQSQDNPFGSLATGIATMMTDKIIDSFISPGGMAAFMTGKKLDDENSQATDYDNIFKNSRYTYDSLDHFSLWIKNDEGLETRIVLKRDALDWKLVNIVTPYI
ncbi:MAG: DUF2939 domain-containing protein [Nitrosomonas sp.]|nr:DUF2939 domain-containing protein [Nitrosomonas sp.]